MRRVPIRRRVLSYVLVTTIAGIVLSIVTATYCISIIKDSEVTALTNQLVTNLKATVRQKAVSADEKFAHYAKYIELVTDYTENMYRDEAATIAAGEVFFAPTDTHEYLLTRGFISEKLAASDFEDEMKFYSNLVQIWDPLSRENGGLISTMYLGTTSGLLVSYDKYSYLSVPTDTDELVYDYMQSSWYQQGLTEDGAFYTGLYQDSQGRGLTITIASPYRDTNGTVRGVDAADFDITELYDELLAIDLGKGAFSLAVDENGSAISVDEEGLLTEGVAGLTSSEVSQLRDGTGYLEKGAYIYVAAPIERVGWSLIACVPRANLQEGLRDADRTIRNVYALFIACALVILLAELVVVNRVVLHITRPMEILEHDMRRIAEGDLEHRAKAVHNDEIGDITNGMNEMVDRLKTTMTELLSTQQRADAMSKLANEDALTGLHNKLSFDERQLELEREVLAGDDAFGIVVIDMNNLKRINDEYGHDKGDIAIKKLGALTCEIFGDEDVYRIGGDEFAVVLRGSALRDVEALVARFLQRAQETRDARIDPWEKVWAAIGYALYDATVDTTVEQVFMCADRHMYENKREMKAAD